VGGGLRGPLDFFSRIFDTTEVNVAVTTNLNKTKRTIQFVTIDWCPTNYKCSTNFKPPKHTICMVSNSTVTAESPFT